MADVKWIKIVTDIFDDEKMILIESLPDADSIMVCWFKLLCLAGKQNNSGVLMLNDRIAYTEEMLATVFRRPLQTVRLALQTFEQFGMVEIVHGTITIPNWGKHQNLDRLEKLRDYQREYHREYRKKQAQIPESVGCQHDSKLYANDPDKDIDIDKDKELDKERKRRFSPPTIEEVAVYCKERNNGVDPQAFVDFYTAKGWKVGKDPMKDWQAAVRTWERREPKGKIVTADRYNPPKKIDAAHLERIREVMGLDE